MTAISSPGTTGSGGGRRITTDLANRRSELLFDWDLGGLERLPNGILYGDTSLARYTIVEGDPLSARVECRTSGGIGRGDWQTRCETESVMTCDADRFLVTVVVRAFEGEASVFAQTWTYTFPRDLV